MCTPGILVGVSLEVGVTSLIERILKACSWRLTVYRGGCTAKDREGLLQILTLLLTMIEMVATGPSPGLLLVSLFRMMRITTINVEARVHTPRVWAMMLWAGLLIRFLNHHLRVELKEENFLGSLLSQYLPCIMAERTLWSTLATSIIEWLLLGSKCLEQLANHEHKLV